MPIDPAERRPLGRTGLTATPLGFGGAPIGGLYRPVADDDAIAVVRRAWDLGIRLFDTAPLYGYGASERRVGAALANRPPDAFVLSTKVGRLVAEVGRIPPGAEIDRQVLDGREDGAYAGTNGRKVLFDFSADGVRRSSREPSGSRPSARDTESSSRRRRSSSRWPIRPLRRSSPASDRRPTSRSTRACSAPPR